MFFYDKLNNHFAVVVVVDFNDSSFVDNNLVALRSIFNYFICQVLLSILLLSMLLFLLFDIFVFNIVCLF